MKLALLSDIHANLQAMQACLQHAKQHGASQYALLGDLVGYGGDPVSVMDCVMQLAQDGALVIQGNHDEMTLNPPTQKNHLGEATADWTHAQLSNEHRQFLATLPLTARIQACLR